MQHFPGLLRETPAKISRLKDEARNVKHLEGRLTERLTRLSSIQSGKENKNDLDEKISQMANEVKDLSDQLATYERRKYNSISADDGLKASMDKLNLVRKKKDAVQMDLEILKRTHQNTIEQFDQRLSEIHEKGGVTMVKATMLQLTQEIELQKAEMTSFEAKTSHMISEKNVLKDKCQDLIKKIEEVKENQAQLLQNPILFEIHQMLEGNSVKSDEVNQVNLRDILSKLNEYRLYDEKNLEMLRNTLSTHEDLRNQLTQLEMNYRDTRDKYEDELINLRDTLAVLKANSDQNSTIRQDLMNKIRAVEMDDLTYRLQDLNLVSKDNFDHPEIPNIKQSFLKNQRSKIETLKKSGKELIHQKQALNDAYQKSSRILNARIALKTILDIQIKRSKLQ